MTGLRAYIFILFGMSAVLYLFGYTSPFLDIVSHTQGNIATDLLNQFMLLFTSEEFLTFLGLSAVVSFFSGGSNFSVTYLIPILMLLAMLNFFVLPTSFILSMEVDPFIKFLVGGFLNLFLVFAMLEFIRGGG